MTVDVDATLQEMHRLMTAEMQEYFEARTPRWYFEMHPELRASLIQGLSTKMGFLAYQNHANGEFCIFDIPVRANAMLTRGVRLVVGARDGTVALLPPRKP